jgi:pimeloyl-ACP methyl ester carboxylesterase
MTSHQSKKKRIAKFFLIGCGTITALVAAVVIWLGVQAFSNPDDVELTPHHPFRSAEAKERYLRHYGSREKNWPVVSESRMVDTSFGKTFVRISGPVDAPPLVLLPGANATSLLWAPNIEAFSRQFRTYAVDNIYDFGRSAYTRHVKTPDDFVNWLNDLFRVLDLEDDINLMGLSYGGWITSQYALRHPERLEKVVLLAPAATVLPFQPEFLMRGILCLLPHRYFVRSMMYWVLEDAAKKNEAGRLFVEEATENMFVGQRCFKPIRLVNPTVLTDEELQSIQVPTLFLVGENEKIYSAREAVARLKTVAPQINVELIPNAGHDMTLAQADLVNSKILEFLEKIESHVPDRPSSPP